ncbi:MAG: hypothetical protein PHF86_04450 [Candidatus Nanoarchaeia archaeon]|jgi:hypothetical protein|nr:hypothetical protein [Candidatus Nanoarchaeia archaeon]
MTDESYLRNLDDDKLISVYSIWACVKSKKAWNKQIMVELRRRCLVRRAKAYHQEQLQISKHRKKVGLKL